MKEDHSESVLLDSARKGDAPAIEALLARHEAEIYRFARKMCRNREDANDDASKSA